MARHAVAVLLIIVIAAACTSPSVMTPSPSASDTLAATAAPAPSAAASTAPRTFASVCGTTSDFVEGPLSGIVLNAPGREPLKVTVPTGRIGVGGYACVGVLAGVPHPLLDGFAAAGTPGFVEPGIVPATAASPAPTGFLLPAACAFVAPPVVSADQTDWKIDCGVANNNNARGTFGTALAQQGWISCAAGLATAPWRKNGVMVAAVESSLAPGDYPRLSQFARLIAPCL